MNKKDKSKAADKSLELLEDLIGSDILDEETLGEFGIEKIIRDLKESLGKFDVNI